MFMAVRVRLALKALKGSKIGNRLETSALVNSGYETDKPELLIPESLASKLGLWPPETIKIEYASTPIGFGRLHSLGEALQVQVITEDKTSPAVNVHVMVSEYEREVLISDRLASLLEIAVEDFGEGIWRFRGEPLTQTRKSEKAEYW